MCILFTTLSQLFTRCGPISRYFEANPNPIVFSPKVEKKKKNHFGAINNTQMAERKAVIKNADMSEDMQQDAVDCASQALEKFNIEKVYNKY